MKNKIHKIKGFTLLFAVLVSILILAVGTSIITLSLKQIILSASNRESQFAFYAANSGIECVYYWDFNPPEGGVVFQSVSGEDAEPDDDSSVKCAYRGRSVDRSLYTALNNTNWAAYPADAEDLPGLETEELPGDVFKTEFYIAFDAGLPYCAHVIVEKSYDNSGTTPILKTKIDSFGYNTCDKNNPRRVERGLRVTY